MWGRLAVCALTGPLPGSQQDWQPRSAVETSPRTPGCSYAALWGRLKPAEATCEKQLYIVRPKASVRTVHLQRTITPVDDNLLVRFAANLSGTRGPSTPGFLHEEGSANTV